MATTPKNIWVIAFILLIISTMCLAGNEYFDDEERRKLMKSGGGAASPLQGIIDEINRNKGGHHGAHSPAPQSDDPPSPANFLTCTLGVAAQILPCLPYFGFNFSGNNLGGNWGWSPEGCCQGLSKINPNCFWAVVDFFETFLPNITTSSVVSTVGLCTDAHHLHDGN